MNQSKISLIVVAAIIALLFIAFLLTRNTEQNGQTTDSASQQAENREETSPAATQEDGSEDKTVSSAEPEISGQTVDEPEPPSAPAENTETTTSEPENGTLYNVVEGNKLDAFSYEGFKLYRNWCARCHGTYGQGMVGPNLAESLNVINKTQFVEVVTHGKTGQIGNMPAWETNESVMKGMDNIYAYLKARADGAIGEVKPQKQ